MIASIAIALPCVYLLVGEPWLGRASFRRMLAALAVALAYRRRREIGVSGQAQEHLPTMVHNRSLMQMLPRTREERLGYAALAVTAGITEEVIWRGFGLTLLFMLLPTLHPAVSIALAAAAFGWAHLGLVGMLATAVIGAILAVLFWASGSLLWPIVAHVLLDLRALLARAPAHATAGGPP